LFYLEINPHHFLQNKERVFSKRALTPFSLQPSPGSGCSSLFQKERYKQLRNPIRFWWFIPLPVPHKFPNPPTLRHLPFPRKLPQSEGFLFGIHLMSFFPALSKFWELKGFFHIHASSHKVRAKGPLPSVARTTHHILVPFVEALRRPLPPAAFPFCSFPKRPFFIPLGRYVQKNDPLFFPSFKAL